MSQGIRSQSQGFRTGVRHRVTGNINQGKEVWIQGDMIRYSLSHIRYPIRGLI